MASRAEIASWVGTGVAHAALAAAIILHRAGAPYVPAVTPPAPIEITLEDHGPAPLADDGARAGASSPAAAGALAMAVVGATSRAGHVVEPGGDGAGAEGAPTASASPSGPPPSLFLPDRVALGLDGPGSYAMQAAGAGLDGGAAAAALQERVRHAILDPLRAHDRALGELGDGPVVAALEDATRENPGPAEGNAVFSITVDAAGKVLSLSLEQSSSDFGTWQDIGRQGERALRNTTVRVPPGSKGMALRIQIRVKLQYPSGARKSVDPYGGVNGSGPYVGGTFDLSDIGTHRSRVVGATLLDAHDL